MIATFFTASYETIATYRLNKEIPKENIDHGDGYHGDGYDDDESGLFSFLFLFFSFLLACWHVGCGAWGLVCNPKKNPSPFNPIGGRYLGT